MEDILFPTSVLDNPDEFLVKRLLYGDHCNGCKYSLRKVDEYPCKFCELISKPSHYVKAKLR